MEPIKTAISKAKEMTWENFFLQWRLALMVKSQSTQSAFKLSDFSSEDLNMLETELNKIKYLSRVNQFKTPHHFTRPYFTRKEAELSAIEKAFEILEKQLTPNELSDETNN